MSPQIAAHLRLIATLPVRTHTQPEPPKAGGLRRLPERRKRVCTGVGRGGNQGKRRFAGNGPMFLLGRKIRLKGKRDFHKGKVNLS